MATRGELKKWFEPLGGGMNQKVKGSQLPFGEAKLLYNITFDKLGSWRSRKAVQLAATTLAGTGGIQGLTSYTKLFGANIVLVAGNRNLYYYDNNNTLVQIGSSDQFQIGAKVNFCNFLNRSYIFSSNTNDIVRYTDGNSIYNVGSTTNQFYAKWGAVAQNTLWVGGISNNPDRIYVSLFDNTSLMPTDQFWNDGESFATSTRFFLVNGENTGIVSFDDRVYAFTENSLWTFDLQSITQAQGPQKVFDIGCVSHATIATDSKLGVMMWTDGKKGVYLWSGAGKPYNVAEKIMNYDDAILDLVGSAQIRNMSAAIHNGKYFLSLGDLSDATLPYYQNAMLVYDIAANKWSIWNTAKAVMTTHRTADGDTKLYGGASDTLSLFEMEVQDDHDTDSDGSDVDIAGIIQTKDFGGEFGMLGNQNIWHEVRSAYTGTSDNVELSFSADSGDYEKFATLPVAVGDRYTRHSTLKRAVAAQILSIQYSWSSGIFELIGLGISTILDDTVGRRPTE